MEPNNIESMLQRVANSTDSSLRFKNQTRDEDDLTFDEKYRIAAQLLQSSRRAFLARFWKALNDDDRTNCFDDDDDEIHFYLRQIALRLDPQRSRVLVRQRRAAKLAHLESEGYFDDESMQARDPQLYDTMIGCFLSTSEVVAERQRREEAAERRDKGTEKSKSDDGVESGSGSRHRFSKLLVEGLIETPRLAERLHHAGQAASDDDSCSDAMSEHDSSSGTGSNSKNAEPEDDVTTVDAEEIERLRQEFRSTMIERFLDGHDSDFLDYRQIDSDEDLDWSDEQCRRAEDKYFDDSDADETLPESSPDDATGAAVESLSKCCIVYPLPDGER